MEQDKPPAGRPAVKTAYTSQQKKNAAEAERKLWAILKRKQIKGEPFKRREPIGPYQVDFYCSGAKLVILLDDRLPDGGALDAKVRWLTSQGCQVVRLGAEDVRRTLWPIVHQLARQYRIRDQPKIRPPGYSGPSFQT